LLTGQALSWFALLFEIRAFVLNNFEAFLETFTEAFEDHDKAHLATTKVRIPRQRLRPVSVYASDFRLLACDINWDKEALMSQFHWGLREDVKDLLLSMPKKQHCHTFKMRSATTLSNSHPENEEAQPQ
jgi:hypothetical protein